MPDRQAAPALVPCDLGMGLPGDHTVQIQRLPFGHVRGGGLDADGLAATRSWGRRRSLGHSRPLQRPRPFSLFPPSPGRLAPLTVGEVGALGLGDRDCDGGLHAVAGPADILACVRWGGLEDVQAGATHLDSHGQGCEQRASQSPAGTPYPVPWSSAPSMPHGPPRGPDWPPPTFLPPGTWCRAGRVPPRLYHVTGAWAWPATTQFRSRVCPSATVGEEDSILTGGTGPGAAGRGGGSQMPPRGDGQNVHPGAGSAWCV